MFFRTESGNRQEYDFPNCYFYYAKMYRYVVVVVRGDLAGDIVFIIIAQLVLYVFYITSVPI